jgi:exopolyphosphatase/guanosine-5'-triphosphate,3'-diphosphate pyrophosphatase
MRIAAIDIGTNSVHLVVAEISPDGQISVVEKQREQVELGAGEFASHRITDEAFDRGVAALTRFKRVCDAHGVEDIHAAATSAVREADNGAEFCVFVKDTTGIHVRVISGHDEARLVYLGARGGIDFTKGRALLFDLGGGSTEFVLCDAERALVLESLPLGHIRLADAFLRSEMLVEPERRPLKSHVQSLLQPLLSRVRGSDFATLVGTSGTVRSLAKMATLMRKEALPEHEHGLLLGRAELDEIVKTFRTKPSSAWGAALPGFDEKRKRTLPAGAVLVREVMKAFSKETLLTSENSLREGLVADWILRHRPELDLSRSIPDPRRRSVLALMARYQADRPHAERVAAQALHLFDVTAALHGLTVDDRRLLELACLVHDVGHYISGKDHHRHGQYLIRHTPMPGFTAPEIALLGNLVRYHRGGRPKPDDPDYAALSARDRRKVRVLSAVMRLADSLDRGHDGNVVQFDARLDAGAVHLRATTRDAGDLERWAAVQRLPHLEEALGRRVNIEIVRSEAQ